MGLLSLLSIPIGLLEIGKTLSLFLKRGKTGLIIVFRLFIIFNNEPETLCPQGPAILRTLLIHFFFPVLQVSKTSSCRMEGLELLCYDHFKVFDTISVSDQANGQEA